MIGLSILSGSHLELIPASSTTLREAGIDVPVVVGGIIPEADVAPLRPPASPRSTRRRTSSIARIMRDIVALVAERNGVGAAA